MLADIETIAHREAHHGVSRFCEHVQARLDRARIHRTFVMRERRESGSDVDEDAIVAVFMRHAQRLALDWDDTSAVFSGRFGNELFRPRAEGRDLGMRDDREFVAADSREFAK